MEKNKTEATQKSKTRDIAPELQEWMPFTTCAQEESEPFSLFLKKLSPPHQALSWEARIKEEEQEKEDREEEKEEEKKGER